MLLVYGWYGRGNVGDELMALALRKMFVPHAIELKFVDHISVADVKASDGIIFGGGSILLDAPSIDTIALGMLLQRKRPTFYLGVGIETNVNIVHKQLLLVARNVVVRSANAPDWLQKSTLQHVPDLVYSLGSSAADQIISAGDLLFIPNVEVLPTCSDPHWMHVAWERFKDETAQFFDLLLSEMKVQPTFLLMCKNDRQDDGWAASEIIARMKQRSTRFNVLNANASESLASFVSEHSVVMTQRFHGIVIAQMAGVPCISIDHHDKLKTAWPLFGQSVAYHGVTKDSLFDCYKLALSSPRFKAQAPKGLYDQIATSVVEIVQNEKASRG